MLWVSSIRVRSVGVRSLAVRAVPFTQVMQLFQQPLGRDRANRALGQNLKE
jgi:hypothetical protein